MELTCKKDEENVINSNFQECLERDYTDQISIIKDAYQYCFFNDNSCDDSIYNSDSYISWSKSAEQRMKKIANNFRINFKDYQTTQRGAHEIPIVVAMVFKTFLCLDSGKGQAGSYLKNGKFEKISHEDKKMIINLTLDFLCDQYKSIPDAKEKIEEGRKILLDYEKYEQYKEEINNKINRRMNDFILKDLDEYYNHVKDEVDEFVDEDDHTGIWATLPQKHTEALSITAKQILLNHLDYYISQALEKWKCMVSIYADSYYINEVEKCVDDKEKESIIADLIEEAKNNIS